VLNSKDVTQILASFIALFVNSGFDRNRALVLCSQVMSEVGGNKHSRRAILAIAKSNKFLFVWVPVCFFFMDFWISGLVPEWGGSSWLEDFDGRIGVDKVNFRC